MIDGVLESIWVGTPIFTERVYSIVYMSKFNPVTRDLIKLIIKGIGNVSNLVYSLLAKLQS